MPKITLEQLADKHLKEFVGPRGEIIRFILATLAAVFANFAITNDEARTIARCINEMADAE